jgi:septal ring factor EnvC (AmiA/AmiB activator)
MEMGKLAAKRIVVWVVMGLLVGGLAADLWWRQGSNETRRELAELKASQARQGQQLEELKGKLAGAEAEANQLREQLKTEQALRHRLEEVLSRGKK